MAKKNVKNEMIQQPAPSTSLALPGMPETGLEDHEKALITGNLPYLILLQSGSDAVKKNDPEGCRGGDYIMRGQIVGRPVLVIPTVSRPHAIYRPKDKDSEDGAQQLESFDMSDPVFEDIKRKQKSRVKGARYGLQFLVWLPEHGTFAIASFHNTARTEAAPLTKARAEKKAVELGSRLVDGEEFSWHVPTAKIVELDTLPPLPTPEQQAEAIESFNAYKLEKAAEAASSKRPR